MSDRSDEKREGYVPVGKYGWRKVGGRKGPIEVRMVGPAWARQLRRAHAAKKRAEESKMDIPNYRTAFRDAEGRPFPREGEVRVFLDDDIEDRRAPEGWVHLRTVREVCMLILQGRVVELSLDNDLNGDVACGVGYQVIDFLEELHGTEDRPLWPRDGITLHTANPEGRNTMKRAIESVPRRLPVEVEDVTTGSKPKYLIRLTEEADEQAGA
jgi:hypothetical protein